MSFHIKEHVIPCQHIRQCVGIETSEERPTRLSVKQYVPTNNPSPTAGDITIIAAHGNGLVKELYEPLWEDLERLLSERGRRTRSIWIADMSNQGASGLLNEEFKYDDVSWYDHSRDLLSLVNHFRAEMIPPLVAVGHSMGAAQLAMLALGHPTLFSTLVLIDPIIDPATIRGAGPMMVQGTLRRRAEWISREEAEKTSKMAFKLWAPSVLEKFNKYALYPYPQTGRDAETQKPTPTRLVTGRFQELGSIVRPAFIYNGMLDIDKMPWADESLVMHDLIGFLPCSTLYVCGALSNSSRPDVRKDWLARTGASAHMGTGMRKRRVEEKVLGNVGHFVPMEAPTACAEAVATWIDEEMRSWAVEEDRIRTWRNLTPKQKEEMANAWMAKVKGKL